MPFAEETNLKSLEKYRDFLREKYARLEENASTKYTVKEKRMEMQNLFDTKLVELDQERGQRLTLRNRLRLYHLVWRTIKKYIEDERNITTPRTKSRLLEDVILKAIYESASLFRRGIVILRSDRIFNHFLLGEQDEEEDFDSGALYDREAGMLLDHIEIFMDMMQRGNYKEASYIAACSPKGVLRNMETLLKFKGKRDGKIHSRIGIRILALKKPLNEEISPWLFHCKVLAETALEASFKLDVIMSLECAKAACSENHLNLLYKWIAEKRFVKGIFAVN